MERRSVEELRDELNGLMKEHIESVRKQAFAPLNDQELREEEERLKRIREVSADYLSALKAFLQVSSSVGEDPVPEDKEKIKNGRKT